MLYSPQPSLSHEMEKKTREGRRQGNEEEGSHEGRQTHSHCQKLLKVLNAVFSNRYTKQHDEDFYQYQCKSVIQWFMLLSNVCVLYTDVIITRLPDCIVSAWILLHNVAIGLSLASWFWVLFFPHNYDYFFLARISVESCSAF